MLLNCCYFLIVYPIPQFWQITCFYLIYKKIRPPLPGSCTAFIALVFSHRRRSIHSQLCFSKLKLIKTLKSTVNNGTRTLKWHIGFLMMTFLRFCYQEKSSFTVVKPPAAAEMHTPFRIAHNPTGVLHSVGDFMCVFICFYDFLLYLIHVYNYFRSSLEPAVM